MSKCCECGSNLYPCTACHHRETYVQKQTREKPEESARLLIARNSSRIRWPNPTGESTIVAWGYIRSAPKGATGVYMGGDFRPLGATYEGAIAAIKSMLVAGNNKVDGRPEKTYTRVTNNLILSIDNKALANMQCVARLNRSLDAAQGGILSQLERQHYRRVKQMMKQSRIRRWQHHQISRGGGGGGGGGGEGRR